MCIISAATSFVLLHPSPRIAHSSDTKHKNQCWCSKIIWIWPLLVIQTGTLSHHNKVMSHERHGHSRSNDARLAVSQPLFFRLYVKLTNCLLAVELNLKWRCGSCISLLSKTVNKNISLKYSFKEDNIWLHLNFLAKTLWNWTVENVVE